MVAPCEDWNPWSSYPAVTPSFPTQAAWPPSFLSPDLCISRMLRPDFCIADSFSSGYPGSAGSSALAFQCTGKDSLCKRQQPSVSPSTDPP